MASMLERYSEIISTRSDMLSHRQTTRCGYLNSRANAVWLISPHWTGERIDYRVHGSFCALGNTMPDILGCLRSVPRHVGCPSGGSRLNSANGDGDGENDRKQCFHGTRISLPLARVRLPISPRYALAIEDWFAHENQRLKRSPNSNRLCRDCQRLFSNTVSSQMTKDEYDKLPPDEKEHFMTTINSVQIFRIPVPSGSRSS